MYQLNSHYCAPASLHLILLHLHGSARSQTKLAGLMDTTLNGTSDAGIIKALRILNKKYEVFQTSNDARALTWLGKRLPSLLCTDDWQHWVAYTGRILDPFGEGTSEEISPDDLLKRWRSKNKPYFYAISIGM